MGRGNEVPDRWENYSNMGRQIPGTRFIAFKVPLKRVMLNRLAPNVLEFDLRTLVDHCPNLGLIIDLTNTRKYYDSKELFDYGIEYMKIFTRGHTIPATSVVKKFYSTVETFLQQNESNDKLIGVHCTHGVNRTGYLICRYMIQQLGVPPDQAIVDFNSARGHEQERENYLTDLKTAPWLLQPTPGSSRLPADDSWRSSDNGYYGDTPPYMPQQSRRKPRAFTGYGDAPYANDQGPYSGSNKRRSRSSSRSQFDQNYDEFPGSPPFKSQRVTRRSSSQGERSVRYEQEPESPGTQGVPFRFGKKYYEQYFKGQVLPQYEVDFYTRGGGGIGPHRPQPRFQPQTPGDGKRPRQYRGPRPYKSPSNEEPLAYEQKTSRHVFFKDSDDDDVPVTPRLTRKSITPRTSRSLENINKKLEGTPNLVRVDGPTRNPLSPGVSDDVFSPECNSGRRKSWRYQPY